MKKILLLVFSTVLIKMANAQSVGIGTNSPAASSLFEINSTSKGMLMPRMSSAQRGAIVSPATGLLVFDTDTKTIWTFDGSLWKNLSVGGGGSLTLPFSQSVSSTISAFQITNIGLGAGIEGSSTNEFGIGLSARSTGGFGWALNSFTNRPGAVSVRSTTDSGIAFHGENSYIGNTNTLMNLINRGLAKTGSFQLSNATSVSPNVQIAGNHLGEQLKIFQTNAANSKAAVSIENSGTGEGLEAITTTGVGVLGTSSSGYGVRGETNTSTGTSGVYGLNTGTAGSGVVGISNLINTQGVYGSSTGGIGVRAASTTYRALQAVSTSGTGVYANSGTGLALEVVGNVRISGGNTNPSNGAILTSDASGNAVWKQRRVAFRATGVRLSQTTLANLDFKRVHFALEDFDYGNNFNVLATDNPDAESSVFTAPVAGVYQFNASSRVTGAEGEDLGNVRMQIVRNRNGGITDLTEIYGYDTYTNAPIDAFDDGIFSTSITVKLNAGDKIYVQVHIQGASSGVISAQIGTQFSGFLVFED